METQYRDSTYHGTLAFKTVGPERYFGSDRMAHHEARHFRNLRIVLSSNPQLSHAMSRYHDTCGLGQCYHYLIKAYKPIFVHAQEISEGYTQGVWVFPIQNPWGTLPINLAIARLLHDHDPRWTLGGIGREANHNDVFVFGELDPYREVRVLLENAFPLTLSRIGRPGRDFAQGSVDLLRIEPLAAIGQGLITTERLIFRNPSGPPRRAQRPFEAPLSDDSDDDDDDDDDSSSGEDYSDEEPTYSDEESPAPRRGNRRVPPSEASDDDSSSDSELSAGGRRFRQALDRGGRPIGRGQRNERSGGRGGGGGRGRGSDDEEPEQEQRPTRRARPSGRGGRTGL